MDKLIEGMMLFYFALAFACLFLIKTLAWAIVSLVLIVCADTI